MAEIEDSARRISFLVGAAKQHARIDRAAHQQQQIFEPFFTTKPVGEKPIADPPADPA